TKLINNKNLWDKNRKTEKLKNVGKKLKEGDSFNYLDIIGKQDDENVFSNLIAYFIENDKELLKDFCDEILNIKISEEAVIEREKSANGPRIDIYIEDENNAIVIENKIKSEVNSVEERHNFTGELMKSQLEDYYNYVEKHAGNRSKKYFILMPNYHRIDLQKYKHSEKYHKIEYSDLVKFFDNHKYHNTDEIGYYEDFKKALRRHAENYYDDQYSIMKRRFIRRIMQCKNS
ncbi:PD-(D/E)XK nuclease family protein, partial [Candidatus Saccharibacteria bacterium]|nr:PD-(D/E)XK nuclease family protein [Candidatus Saccharibacteria bacterium]